MKSKNLKIVAVFVIATLLLCLGIGYAAVSKELTLNPTLEGTAQNNVFITSSSGSDSNFFSTILTSQLPTLAAGGSVTHTITVYNSDDEPYGYIDTTGVEELNEGVSYSVNLTPGNWIDDADQTTFANSSVVCAGSSKTFTVTFTNSGTETATLTSTVNFVFKPLSEIHVVALDYNGQTYYDCLDKDSVDENTLAEFPVTVTPTDTTNNVARCNYGAVPVYNSSTGTVNVKHLTDGENHPLYVRCKIYSSLSAALRDGNYVADGTGAKTGLTTVNNFLVLCDLTDTGTATLPANEEWNVDFAGNVVEHVGTGYGTRFITLKYDSTLTFKSTPYTRQIDETKNGQTYLPDKTVYDLGGISSNARIVEMRNVYVADDATSINTSGWGHPVLRVNGGAYESTGESYLFEIRQGGSMRFENAILKNKGNVFNIGEKDKNENILCGENRLNHGTAYDAKLELIECNAQSTAGNALHTTTRQTFLCNLLETTLTAAKSVILADGGTDENDGIYVFEGVRMYLNGCKLTCTTSSDSYHFRTHGVRMYYTRPRYGGYKSNGAAVSSLTSASGGAAERSGILLKNFRVRCYTSDTSEDWFYITDADGNRVVDYRKQELRVGDEVQMLAHSGTLLDPQVLLGIGIARDYDGGTCVGNIAANALPRISTDGNTIEQRWIFIPSNTPGYYHIGTYHLPTLSMYANSDYTIKLADHTSNSGYTKDACKFQIKYYTGSSVDNRSGRFELINRGYSGYSLGLKGEVADYSDYQNLTLVSNTSTANLNKRIWATLSDETKKGPVAYDLGNDDTGTLDVYSLTK